MDRNAAKKFKAWRLEISAKLTASGECRKIRMSDKTNQIEEFIATYLSRTTERRKNVSAADRDAVTMPGVTGQGGVITVHGVEASSGVAKPGGVTKAFGESKIWIPEYKGGRR
ncbi:MAG TPA: hypothetical protein VIE65_20575 [Methylobacter sp.]